MVIFQHFWSKSIQTLTSNEPTWRNNHREISRSKLLGLRTVPVEACPTPDWPAQEGWTPHHCSGWRCSWAHRGCRCYSPFGDHDPFFRSIHPVVVECVTNDDVLAEQIANALQARGLNCVGEECVDTPKPTFPCSQGALPNQRTDTIHPCYFYEKDYLPL